MKTIAEEKDNLPAEIPVMILHRALLFPHSLLPLRIFEPRYRTMLDYCLTRDRMFCIALMKPGVTEAGAVQDFFQVGGVGLVRACVEMPDGTSNLVLQGLIRVQLTDFVQSEPFRIARTQELKSKITNAIECEALAAKVLEICASLKAQGLELPPAVQKQMAHLSNPDLIADIVASAFVRDPFQRQQVLEEVLVSERLRLLIKFLSDAIL